MKAIFLLASLCLTYVNAGDVMGLIEDCGSTGGAVAALDFEGCDADYDDQCEVARGTTANGKLTFSATGAAETLECQIYGIILGIEIPFPGGCPVVDACSVKLLHNFLNSFWVGPKNLIFISVFVIW